MSKRKFVTERFAGTHGGFYKGVLYLLAPGVYEIEVLELGEKTVEKESTSFQRIKVKENRLRPLDKDQEKQKKIDAWLEKSKKTVEQALEVITQTEREVIKGRSIELNLGFKVKGSVKNGIEPSSAGGIKDPEIKKRQRLIDKWMDDHGDTVDPLGDDEMTVDGETISERLIEKELGFEVEFYLHESESLKEVPLVTEEKEQVQKKLEKIECYFKPTGVQLRKTIINLVNSKK